MFPWFKQMLNDLSYVILTKNPPSDRVNNMAARLFGPAGGAKSTFPEMIAAALGIPLFTIPLSNKSKKEDLDKIYNFKVVNGKMRPIVQPGLLKIAVSFQPRIPIGEDTKEISLPLRHSAEVP